MEKRRPRKGRLYTWNYFDGWLGKPSRKIELSGLDHRLLKIAYLAGGPRWDDKTPEKGLVCLVLQASARPQCSLDYEVCYDGYRLEHLRSIGHCEEMGGLDRAMWEIQIPIVGCSDSEIDNKIVEVLRWHIAEIQRILASRPLKITSARR